jgi:putative transposase
MDIRDEVLDELLSGYEKPEDLLGDNGLLKRLKKALIERALGAKLTTHLGYEKGDPAGRGSGNIRNGYSKKTLKTDVGNLEIEVPRDRQGSFEPQLVPKGETRFDGFDDRIVGLYARGMTVREIQGHLQELYGVRGLARSDQPGHRCRSRGPPRVAEPALDPAYPIVFFDALRVKIGDGRNKAVYVALALDVGGEKRVLGL